MLIIFKNVLQGQPNLPNIHVKDTELDSNVPVACIDGWDDDKIQGSALVYGPLEWKPEETFSASGEFAATYYCQRLSQILLNAKFSVAAQNCVVNVKWYDRNDILSVSADITLTAGSIQDDSDYVAPIGVISTYGANKMSLHVESVSSGNVDLRLAAI